MAPPSHQTILKALEAVIDPDFQKNIVSLGFVQNLAVSEQGHVDFDVILTTPACPVKERFRTQCHSIVAGLAGVQSVEVRMGADTRRNSPPQTQGSLLGQVRNILGIASGKGGVGKSTVTANLAMSLALSGARVGVLDADIYGPSMSLMLGAGKPEVHADKTLTPAPARGGLVVVSMAMFSDPAKATIWRGPMASQMIQNFLHRVHWGELDYLLIDFPPGTGDIQLTLTQQCPLAGAVVVTTPQEVSLADVRKGLQMFRAVAVPVVGVVENMSYFICDSCQKEHRIFSHGGGLRICESLGLDLLGQVPLEASVAQGGDAGLPAVIAHPNSISAQIFTEITGKTAAALSILSEGGSRLGSFRYSWEEFPENGVGKATTLTSPVPQPVLLRRENGGISISWSDASVSLYPLRDLRLACPCASCVDEWTGEALLQPASVPGDINPTLIYSVGRYAISVHWSDGHGTGIYSFNYLRKVAGKIDGSAGNSHISEPDSL